MWRIAVLALGVASLAGCKKGPCEGCLDEEICDNGVDDDGNGLADCDDVEACPADDFDAVCYAEPPPCEPGREAEVRTIQAGTLSAPIFAFDLERATGDRIGEAGDRDCFAFEPTAGTSYMMYLSHRNEHPDTVVQILDSSFALIAENDDLPYRLTETDSALEFVAQSDDTLYIQVLEFSDWSPDEKPEGGNSYRYDLLLSEVTIDEPNEAAGNETFTDAVANWLDSEPDLYEDPYAGQIGWVPARIGEPGDVDVIPIEVQGARLCQLSTYPHSSLTGWSPAMSALDPVWELYHEEGCDVFLEDCTGSDVVRVASTDDPAIYSNAVRSVATDAGISFPVPEAGMYYLRVTDAAGGGSARHAYTALVQCSTLSLTYDAENGADSVIAATRLDMTNATSGELAGFLDNPGGTDVIDSFEIRDGPRSGAYVNVIVETTTAGSALADPVVKLWRKNGDGTATEIASASGPDPRIEDHVLTGDDDLYVSFESASDAQGPDVFYLARVAITDEPFGPE